MNPVMEESVESILDASDLSFEESRDDILGESRLRTGGYGQQQRRFVKSPYAIQRLNVFNSLKTYFSYKSIKKSDNMSFLLDRQLTNVAHTVWERRTSATKSL